MIILSKDFQFFYVFGISFGLYTKNQNQFDSFKVIPEIIAQPGVV